MSEDEFRDLIDVVRQRLASLGLAEIADDDLYRVSPESDELLPPDKHLIAMLDRTTDVLGRYDGATVDRALERIAEVTSGAPGGVEYLLPTDRGLRRVDLSRDLPRLEHIRDQLSVLIGQLAEARPES